MQSGCCFNGPLLPESFRDLRQKGVARERSWTKEEKRHRRSGEQGQRAGESAEFGGRESAQ